MSSYFAAVFPSQNAAQEAQGALQRHHDGGLLRVAASVVIVRNEDGEITQHGGHTPGALGAGMMAVAGGVIGLLGGPALAGMGAAAGALSGGWFDLLREGERTTFLSEVARHLATNEAALLGEAIDPDDEAKRQVEADIVRLGGRMVGRTA